MADQEYAEWREDQYLYSEPEKTTYIVCTETNDGGNTYYQTRLLSIDNEDIEKEDGISHSLIIREIYGVVPEMDDWWDIGGGCGYPLVQVYSYKEVKDKEHIKILKEYL